MWAQKKEFQKGINRNTPKEKGKGEEHLKELDKLFDIAAVDAEEVIMKDRLRSKEKKDIDLMFLKDQRGPRLMMIVVKIGIMN